MTTTANESPPDATDPRAHRAALSARLAAFTAIQPGERAALHWSAACFFFLMAGYYVLRSIRDALGTENDERVLQRLFLGTLIGTVGAIIAYSWLVSRYPRSVFLPLVYRFAQLNLLMFAAAMALLPAGTQKMASWAFFVWLSVFNLFAVVVFWSFMADLFTSEQGARLFGFVGAGGTLGAAAGAFLNTRLAGHLGVVPLLLLSVVMLEIALLCLRRLRRLSASSPVLSSAAGSNVVIREGGVFEALARVLYSPYLLAIVVCMLMYTFSTTFLYFQQADIVRAGIAVREQRTIYFARIDLYINAVTLALQLLATARLVRILGVGGSIAVLPAVTAAGFAILAGRPTLDVLFWFQVVKNAANYAVGRPAREMLYTVLRPEEKYKSKGCVDTLVFRAGDAVSASGYRLVAAAGSAALLTAVVGMAAAWIGAGWLLGRWQAARAAHVGRMSSSS